MPNQAQTKKTVQSVCGQRSIAVSATAVFNRQTRQNLKTQILHKELKRKKLLWISLKINNYNI